MQTTIFLLVTKHGYTASSNQRFENQTKCCEFEAKVKDVQTSYETAFLELSNNVTEIKTEQNAHKSTILVLDTRLKQLESVIDDGTCNNTMLHDIDVRILQLEKGTSRQRSGKGAIRKRFPLQKPRWEKTKPTIKYLYHETYRKPNEQLFSQ